MFIRPINVKKAGKNHKYWALVESCRTERGPRQRMVAYPGKLPQKVCHGVKRAAEGRAPSGQSRLFDRPEPQWVEVDTSRVRVERCRDYGGPWLGLKLARKLGLPAFLRRVLPHGREDVSKLVRSIENANGSSPDGRCGPGASQPALPARPRVP